ncbi:RNA polymerase sigma-70 factor (sigma-E family) [Nocardioides zeae]|uniref:RNA polymerase sigma-70 factor (Sigma-E family) n=1 Tax=Nocardioides zeae TaxID=1457234 RepID=A0ACC6ILU9_9ACTN|nr:SigE family RNA polymerase sigma factor [Nocardioides zeae]MDR6175972.1 RNA polymerase sigma-70 factor (sigma-E family) [Nocardioides zeae]MDR6211731.1 RNA polymerase sigma-70 factor (sigma-E family) [Nocardioides zeae]
MERYDEFSDFVATRWPRLVRSAVLLGCSPAEAEDVVQTALELCLRKWSLVRGADDRDAYVHRVLINTFTSSRRRRWVGERPTAVLPEEHGPDRADEVDLADAVLRALRTLTTEQRAVAVLRYYAHLSEKQTAEALGVAPGTVKSRLSRALRVLAGDPDLVELRGAP